MGGERRKEVGSGSEQGIVEGREGELKKWVGEGKGMIGLATVSATFFVSLFHLPSLSLFVSPVHVWTLLQVLPTL